MRYYTKIEKLKMLMVETMENGNLDPSAFDEEDIDHLMGYMDNICIHMKDFKPDDKVHYLLKVVLNNAAQSVLFYKQSLKK
jgi:hypothetical protein